MLGRDPDGISDGRRFLVEVVVYRAGGCGKYNVYISLGASQYDEDLEALVAQGVCGPSLSTAVGHL